MEVTRVLYLKPRLIGQMMASAYKDHPNETVGMFVGVKHQVDKLICWEVHEVFHMVNVDNEPQMSYAVSLNEQQNIFKECQRRGEEPLGVYHSHPTGLALLSPRDRILAHTSLVQVVIGMRKMNNPEVNAWQTDPLEEDPISWGISTQLPKAPASQTLNLGS